jgi:hypothetical protein
MDCPLQKMRHESGYIRIGIKMIISEKQIMQLYDIARMCGHLLLEFGGRQEKVEQISHLLETIREQQSEDLKVIE